MEKKSPIAVVGVSALFPGSIDKTGFYRDILEGTDRITDVPPTHWLIEDYYDPDPSKPDKTYAKRGAFLPEVDFDPIEWGIPPSIVPATDTAQLLSLIVAKQVLEDAANGSFQHLDREKMSVILGVTSAQELLGSMVSRLQRPIWVKGLREAGLPEDEVQAACDKISAGYGQWQESTFPGVLGNVVAGRIANRLDLHGTNCVTDAACASSLAALSMGVNELRLGQSDLVICGGADTMNDIFMYMCFSKTPALSKSGDCRPFSDKADGTMLGEGIGMVALRRLEDAERGGDRIYAVITGIGTSSDGVGKSVYAPVATGQARALRRAYAIAGYGPDTVELVEAHGTGTKAGDAAEFEGLRTVFDESGRADRQWCTIGSVKSQIGHTKAAAGAAGLVKAVLALHHKVLPPATKIEKPNPALALETSPFEVSTRARPWVRGSDHPRRASVSSFGFGGSNFHIALEEYGGPAPKAARSAVAESELVILTGASAAEVAEKTRGLVADLADPVKSQGLLRYLARETQAAYDAGANARLALVAKSDADLADKLRGALDRLAKGEAFTHPSGIFFGTGAHQGGVAFLFPGQGSQYVDMGAAVAMTWDVARAPWDLAASIDFGGETEKLHRVVFPPSAYDDAGREAREAKLRATEWAQPGIGATSLSYLRLLRAIGLEPSAVAGHSFGEVTALHAAGALSEADALRVARRRGELMRDAASTTPGAMTAVSADVERVRGLLATWGLPVVVANHNHPTQVVLSGQTDAIAEAERRLAAEKITAKRLSVATAFHSEVVAASTVPFGEFLATVELCSPSLPVYANATAAPYATDPAAARAALASQIASPVRFVEQIEAMAAAGVRTFVEVGPGSVLTGLVDRILDKRPHRAVPVDRKGKNGLTGLALALGELAAAGVPMKLAALAEGFEAVDDPRARKRPKLVLKLNGSNYDKPYPPKGGAAALPKPNPPRAVTAPKAAQVNGASNGASNGGAHEAVRVAASSVSRETVRASASGGALESISLGASAPRAEAVAPHGRSAAENTAERQIVSQPKPPMNEPSGGYVANGAYASGVHASGSGAAEPAVSVEWLRAYVAVQQQTAEAHAAYARAMADAHAAFLRTAEVSTFGLSAMATGGLPQPGPIAFQPSAPAPVFAAPAPVAAPVAPAPVFAAPAPVAAPVAPAPVFVAPAPVFVAPAPVAAAPAPVAAAPAPVAAPAAHPSAAPADLEAIMMAVVAEKTGYPPEMLGLDMDLEADLGVDSIKRVEILSAVREKAPSLPEVDAGELGKLRTLGEIVARMRGGAAAPVAEAPAVNGSHEAPAPKAAAAPAEKGAADLEALMMAVVAEKTGYPPEMLGLDMDLEADLGVDSIKRVEILSAVREKEPSLPEVDAGELGKMRTLGQIVEAFRGRVASPAVEGLSAPKASSAPEHPALGRFPLRLVPAPALGFALRGIVGARTRVITRDGAGVAEALSNELSARGLPAVVVDEVPSDADAVIFLGGLADVADVDGAVAVNRAAFRAAKAVAATLTAREGAFVTVQDTGGDFGLAGSPRAWLGGLPGLVKTAAQEWPSAGLRAIDVERGERAPTELAKAIADELLAGGVELEVGLAADGTRRTLESVREAIVAGAPALAAGDVVVASGGARGVTAATLVALAERTRCRLVLLGRTPLEPEPEEARGVTGDAELKRALLGAAKARGQAVTPAALGQLVSRIAATREVEGTLARVRAAGGDAVYVAADVQDLESLRAALAPVRESWGPIAGIVHGAGVLADKLITDKTEAQFDSVFDTKVRGLRNLLAVTSKDDLSLLVFFSSVAARSGNRGQCDYAMANEVLNKVANAERARRGGRVVVKSLGWGPWEGGMVTPQLKARFESLGVPLIPLAVGARMLVDEATDASPGDVEIVLGGEPGAEALLHDEGGASTRAFEVLVSEASHPYLDGHRVQGAAVVPVVLVLEWFARAARALRPDLVFAGCSDVKVLRGIRLAHYGTGVDRFRIEARLVSNGKGATYALTLLGAGGERHYTANAVLHAAAPSAPAPASAPSSLEAAKGPVYGGVLFHGPAFQAIRELEGVSPDGGAARLAGARSLGWSGAFETDPAILDGGLQLALLWTEHATGGASLPTSVQDFHVYSSGLAAGDLRCILTAREARPDRGVCDLVFVDEGGKAVAELRGVQTHVLPR